MPIHGYIASCIEQFSCSFTVWLMPRSQTGAGKGVPSAAFHVSNLDQTLKGPFDSLYSTSVALLEWRSALLYSRGWLDTNSASLLLFEPP